LGLVASFSPDATTEKRLEHADENKFYECLEGNYERAGGGLQKRENILKSGPVTVNSRAVIQIWAGNLDSGWYSPPTTTLEENTYIPIFLSG